VLKLLKSVLLLVALPLTSSGCGKPANETPSRPLPIDAQHGTYLGVGVGDSLQVVVRRFGTPVHVLDTRGPNEYPTPLGEDEPPWDLGFPGIRPPPGHPRSGVESARALTACFRYADVSFFVPYGKVHGFVVRAEDAETERGVGIGDALDTARNGYAPAHCAEAHVAAASDPPRTVSYPSCEAKLGRYTIYFGEDRIKSITLWESGSR
jgi:hypothetical protein